MTHNIKYDAGYANGICWASNGQLVAAYQNFEDRGSAGILIKGDQIRSRVEAYEHIVWNTFLYPNPASKELKILSVDASRPISIYDMLGREMLKGYTDSKGKLLMDISSLSRGIYFVMLDHYGKILPIGKVAVIR